jgi:hypothetical protein
MKLGAIVSAALIVAMPLSAQVGFESAFKDITDVNFFYSCWNTKGGLTRSSCPSTKSGYGIEVSYDLGKFPLSRSYEVKGGWADTTRILPCKPPECAGGDQTRAGTVASYKRRGSTNPYVYLRAEFALSYSQFSGFGSSDTSFDLRGTVREIPGVALYVTLKADSAFRVRGFAPHYILDYFSPYFGIKSGLIQLSGVQALDHGPPKDSLYTTYAGASTAFQIGAAVGLVASFDRLHIFIERTSAIRRFANVQWTGSTNRIPKKLPTELDFTGRTVTAGVQYSIKM